jgi:hypothetical protein
LVLRQWAGSKGNGAESGKSEEKAHEPHPQHVRADQEVSDGESKGESSLSMRRVMWQRCLLVGHPASKPGLKKETPMKYQGQTGHVGCMVVEKE